MKFDLKTIAAFLAVYIIWGSTYLGIKFAIDTIPPFSMAALRFIIAGTILFFIARKNSKEKISRRHLGSAAIIGLLLLLGGNGGVVWAEQYISSGLTALLVSTVPLWIVLINWAVTKERKNLAKNLTGVVIGFTGLYFLISPENLISGSSYQMYASLVLIGATLSWSAGSVYTRYAVLPKSSLYTTSLQMIFGGSGLLIASIISGEPERFNISGISLQSFLSLLYLIFFGSLIAYSAYIWLLKKSGPAKATTYAYVNPVVAVILGWLFAGELISLNMIIPAAVVVIAVVIILTDFTTLRKGKRIEPDVS
jgi:drug/metabolite transporter (DMT)-like permease